MTGARVVLSAPWGLTAKAGDGSTIFLVLDPRVPASQRRRLQGVLRAQMYGRGWAPLGLAVGAGGAAVVAYLSNSTALSVAALAVVAGWLCVYRSGHWLSPRRRVADLDVLGALVVVEGHQCDGDDPMCEARTNLTHVGLLATGLSPLMTENARDLAAASMWALANTAGQDRWVIFAQTMHTAAALAGVCEGARQADTIAV